MAQAPVSLNNRKRLSDLSQSKTQADVRKDELLAMKLDALNEAAEETGQLLYLPLGLLRPDPNQPRKIFKNIETLARSIKAKGIIQPIIVTEKQKDGYYQIIAGERRYRAALQAKLDCIPCIVRHETDTDVLIIQLLENDQRERVSPFEEADALAQLIEQHKVKKSDLANDLGRNNSWISMRLKLAEANHDVRGLSYDEMIDDVRTLYDLMKFSDEMPDAALELIGRIRQDKVKGSYREAIKRTRARWKLKKVPVSKSSVGSEVLDPEFTALKSQFIMAELCSFENGCLNLFIPAEKRNLAIMLDAQALQQLKEVL